MPHSEKGQYCTLNIGSVTTSAKELGMAILGGYMGQNQEID